jgi:hypothetical protein
MAVNFMSYGEYIRKQKEIAEKIQKLKQRYDFSWDNMGTIDTASHEEGKRLMEESKNLEMKAREWQKRFPHWAERLKGVM